MVIRENGIWGWKSNSAIVVSSCGILSLFCVLYNNIIDRVFDLTEMDALWRTKPQTSTGLSPLRESPALFAKRRVGPQCAQTPGSVCCAATWQLRDYGQEFHSLSLETRVSV